MSPNRSSLPDDRRQPSRSAPDTGMSWGSRQSESKDQSRADARVHNDDWLVHCPSCGSEKTTVVQSADRGHGSSIRRDNPGFKCFSCGTGWTVTVGDDRDGPSRAEYADS